MITESVEIPRPLREAYERWTRDETIPAAMRGAEHPTGGDPAGDGAEIAWSERNDAPSGRITTGLPLTSKYILPKPAAGTAGAVA